MVILTNPRADSIPGRRGALMNDRQRVKPLHHQWVTRYDIKILGDIITLKIDTPECFGEMDGKPFPVTHHWIAHILHDLQLIDTKVSILFKYLGLTVLLRAKQ